MHLWSGLGWHGGGKSSIVIVESSNGRRGVTFTLADAMPPPVTFAAAIKQVSDVPLANDGHRWRCSRACLGARVADCLIPRIQRGTDNRRSAIRGRNKAQRRLLVPGRRDDVSWRARGLYSRRTVDVDLQKRRMRDFKIPPSNAFLRDGETLFQLARVGRCAKAVEIYRWFCRCYTLMRDPIWSSASNCARKSWRAAADSLDRHGWD